MEFESGSWVSGARWMGGGVNGGLIGISTSSGSGLVSGRGGGECEGIEVGGDMEVMSTDGERARFVDECLFAGRVHKTRDSVFD